MRVAVVQMCSGDDPAQNLNHTLSALDDAASRGADLICTPEVTNCVSASRWQQQKVLVTEGNDKTLSAVQQFAASRRISIHLGSLALAEPALNKFVNRSFLIDEAGQIAARYDKMHMFDVSLSDTENYRESDVYQAGDRAVVHGNLGLSICYDLRFAYLYRALAQAGANVLLVPSAFAVSTGQAHWETLLRARAIETGCFVVAAAHTGAHPSQTEKRRTTYGHSMVVDPWGRVLMDAGTDPSVNIVDLDLQEVAKARQRIPALTHDVDFKGPE